MKDESKTKSQLISELKKLRRENNKLKSAGNGLDVIVKERLENEMKFRLLYENMPIAYQSLDKNGNILEVNKAWCKALGYKRNEVIGENFSVFLAGDSKKNFKKLFSDFKKKGSLFNIENDLIKKNGEIIIMSSTERAGYNKDGSFRQTHCILNDITAQKIIKEKLIKSEERFRGIIENTTIGFYRTTKLGRIVFANPALVKMLGYSDMKELQELNVSKEGYYSNKTRLEFMKKIESKGYVIGFESKWKKRDGTVLYISENARVVRDKNKRVLFYEGSVQDITERKKAEEENLLLAQTLKSAKDCISITDLKNNLLFVNGSFLSTYGYTEDEIIGKNISIVRSPHETIDLNKVIVPDTLKGGWHGELMNLRKDGSEFPIELWTSLVNDNTGKPIALVGIARDITDRKRTEEALKISEERLALALESSELGLWDQNMVTGEIVRNEHWAEMLGYTLDEIEPDLKSWKNLIHPDDLQKVNLAINKHEEGKTKSYKVEHRMRTKNGEWKWVLDWGRIVERDKNNKPLRAIGTHLDITEIKKVENELRKYSENQSILIREINHRVRNNLTAIIGMLYSEEDVAKAKGAEACLPVLRNLVTRIIGLSTAHSMLSEVEWQPLKLTQLCENVINATVKSMYSSKNIHLKIAPADIYVDSNQAHHLALVINELVTNSMKYAQQEKEKIIININAKLKGNNVIFEFHDDGPGYPLEMLKGDFSKTSTGFDLLNGIVKRSLFGEVEISNENGALTTIIFKKFEEKNK